MGFINKEKFFWSLSITSNTRGKGGGSFLTFNIFILDRLYGMYKNRFVIFLRNYRWMNIQWWELVLVKEFTSKKIIQWETLHSNYRNYTGYFIRTRFHTKITSVKPSSIIEEVLLLKNESTGLTVTSPGSLRTFIPDVCCRQY